MMCYGSGYICYVLLLCYVCCRGMRLMFITVNMTMWVVGGVGMVRVVGGVV